MSRRDDALATAVKVLGNQGLYGLTHRKVDRAGGLPDGTTSNYFRTRSSLLRAVVDHIATQEAAIWESGAFDHIDSLDELVDASARFVTWAVGAGRPRSVALIALLEAAIVEPEVAAVLADARGRVEQRSAAVCAAVGLDQAASVTLLDLTDALIFRILSITPDSVDPREYFAWIVPRLADKTV